MTDDAPSPVETLPSVSSSETETDNPYVTARRLRANSYLDLARTATNYRILALLLLLIDCGLVAALVWQSAQTRIVPYVVQTDRYGNAVAFGPAEELADPDRTLLIHEISRWVRNVRTVSLDADIQRHLVTEAYAYVDGRATSLLNRWYRDHPPFARAEDGSVSVQVDSVLTLSSEERTWQVQWIETHRSRSGRVTDEQRWQALLTIAIDPPERIEARITNPLGVKVIDLDWSPNFGDPEP